MTTNRLDRLSFEAASLFGSGSIGFPEHKSGFSTSNGARRRGNSKERNWSTPRRCPGAEWVFRGRSSLPGRGVRIVESLQGRAPYFCSITPLERSTVFAFTWARSLKSQRYSEQQEWTSLRYFAAWPSVLWSSWRRRSQCLATQPSSRSD